MSANARSVILADLADLIGTQVDPRDQPDALYIGLEHVGPSRFIRIGGGIAAEVQSSKFTFKKGDVLYGKLRPYLDKAVLAEQDGICTTELLVLRAKEGIDPRFLIGVVHCRDFIEHAISGTTGSQHPRTSWHRISEFELPNFTPDEQAKIANMIWTTHNSLLACEEAIDAGVQLKRTAMRELFTRGLHGEARSDTEIGLVPKSWKNEELGSMAEIVYGAQAAVANATDPSIGTLILTNVNLDLDGNINLEKKRYYKILEKHRDRLSLFPGDVLFNWRSGSADHVGKTVYFDLDGDFTFSSFILRFRPYRAVSSKFLFRWLTHLRVGGFFNSQSNISSINSVYNASLSATIPICYPEVSDQNEIVAILDTLDHKIELQKRKRAVLEDLFKALLHKLMTGEIRVADLDLSVLSKAPLEGAAA